TAKGFIFVLLEDEAGMVNVIVRPDVYERYRTAVRGEPLLWVRGKLAKDDGTVNVLAEEAQGLKVGTRNAERGTNSESDSSASARVPAARPPASPPARTSGPVPAPRPSSRSSREPL